MPISTKRVIADALSYFASAYAVRRIRKPEPVPESGQGNGIRGIANAVGEGFRFLAKDRILAPLAGTKFNARAACEAHVHDALTVDVIMVDFEGAEVVARG